MPSPVRIRPREPHDDPEIAAVVSTAFGGIGEVNLIHALRDEGAMVSELVAADEGKAVLGYILFSRLAVISASQNLRAIALAPLAVRPDVQRTGIGDALTREGLARARAADEELAVVLGHPKYYARFGFSALLAKLLDAPYRGDAFMALELKPGVLAGLKWKVTYARAFAAPGAH
jgi:putative acetyltransferase